MLIIYADTHEEHTFPRNHRYYARGSFPRRRSESPFVSDDVGIRRRDPTHGNSRKHWTFAWLLRFARRELTARNVFRPDLSISLLAACRITRLPHNSIATYITPLIWVLSSAWFITYKGGVFIARHSVNGLFIAIILAVGVFTAR